MGRTNPPVASDHGPREDVGNPQLLESLDATDNIHQRVPRPDLVQGDVGGRKAMHSPLASPSRVKARTARSRTQADSGARSIIAISSPTWRCGEP